MTLTRLGLGLLIVLAFIGMVMLAQGIGTQLGGGVQEWLVR